MKFKSFNIHFTYHHYHQGQEFLLSIPQKYTITVYVILHHVSKANRKE